MRFFCLTLVILVALSSPAYADVSDYVYGISAKLGRGVLNVISSPLEIPCSIRDAVSDEGGGDALYGFFRGLALMTRRILVGVTEVGTFVIPMEATLPKVCSSKPKPAIQL